MVPDLNLSVSAIALAFAGALTIVEDEQDAESSQLDALEDRVADLEAAGATPAPAAPAFTVRPSIAGTPQVGQTLTGMDGTITNGTAVSRRWLLGAAVVSTAQTYLAKATGSLVYEVTAEGAGGTVKATSTAVTIAAVETAPPTSGSLQRLSLASPIHYNETAGPVAIQGATAGSTIDILSQSYTGVPTLGGLTVDNVARTIAGKPTLRSLLLREKLGSDVRHTLIGLPESAAPTMKIGMNPGFQKYYNPNRMYLDYLKPGGWTDNNAVRDANHMPQSLNGPSDYLWPVDDARAAPIKYRIITDGDFDVSYYGISPTGQPNIGFTPWTKEDDEWVFTHTHAGVPDYNFYLRFTAIRTPPTKIAIVRDDEAARFRSGKMLKASCVADLGRFSHLRDLNISKCTEKSWNIDRSADYIQYIDYVPIAARAAICKELNIPWWFQLNYAITDDQFRALYPILDDMQARGLLDLIEYGNETWNAGFGEQYAYLRDKAMADPRYTEGNQYSACMWQAGLRTAELAKIARLDGKSYRFGMGPQPAQPDQWYVIRGGRDAVPGRLISDIQVYTTTAYCSGVVNLDTGEPLGPIFDQWVATGDYDALLDNILNYVGPYSSSMKTAAGLIQQSKANADSDGMELWGYEGNLHLNCIPYARRPDGTFDPYMKAFVEIYKSVLAKISTRQILETAQAGGMKRLTWFDWDTLATPPLNGDFGTVGKPAYDVLVDWQASLVAPAAPAPAPAPGTMAWTPADLSKPVLGWWDMQSSSTTLVGGSGANQTDIKVLGGVGERPDATQTDAGKRPSLASTGWDGTKPCAVFGIGDLLDTTVSGAGVLSESKSKPFTYVFVVGWDRTAYLGLNMSATPGAHNTYVDNTGVLKLDTQGVKNAYTSPADTVKAGKSIIIVRFDGDQLNAVSVNGVQIAFSGDPVFTPEGTMQIGNGGPGKIDAFAAALRIDGAVSDDEMRRLEGYFAAPAQWDMAASLPAAHPYKSSPPTK